MARGAGQGSVGLQGLWGKGELGSWSERAHNLIAQETAISIQCQCRYPVDRQPHSHRPCASTGDRKSSHQAASIVCSQFALLSPDSATSQRKHDSYLSQQCLRAEKDVVSTEAEAMPVDISAAVDAAAAVQHKTVQGVRIRICRPTDMYSQIQTNISFFGFAQSFEWQ